MRFLILHVIFLLLLSAGDVFASGRPPAPQFTPAPDNGQPALSVRNFARHYGFDRIDRQEDRVVLKGEVHELVLFQGSRRALLNGTLVWLNEPVVVHRKTWVLTERDVRFTLAPVLRPFTVLHDQGFQVVVLDPGHGGEDPGALSPSGLQEKEVVLDVARRVRALLLRQGVRVYLTRHDDRFLELDERPRRAGRWQVDAFVSLHVNSGAATALGAETFVLSLPGSLSTNQNPASPAPTNSYPGNTLNGPNMALAYSLHHALRSVPGVVDRGVKRARFSVLRQSPAPAALVEMGFLSHPEEGKKFQDSAYRDEMARSIARGIDNYLRAVKKARMASEAQQQEKN